MALVIRELAGEETRLFEPLFSTVWPTNEHHAEMIEWAFRKNPFGQGVICGAFPEDRPRMAVGARGSMLWPLRPGSGESLAVYQLTGTCTHPDFQRMGVFSKLNLRALEIAVQRGGDAVFNVSVDASRAGYEKLGWSYLPGLRKYVRFARPLRVALALLRGRGSLRGRPGLVRPQRPETPDWGRVERFATGREDRLAGHHHTVYTREFFDWRFSKESMAYRFLADDRDGLCVYRLLERKGLREALIGDLWPGDDATGGCASLVKALIRRERPDLISIVFSRSHPLRDAVRAAGFRPDPKGDLHLGIRALSDRAGELLEPDRWAIMMADIDTF